MLFVAGASIVATYYCCFMKRNRDADSKQARTENICQGNGNSQPDDSCQTPFPPVSILVSSPKRHKEAEDRRCSDGEGYEYIEPHQPATNSSESFYLPMCAAGMEQSQEDNKTLPLALQYQPLFGQNPPVRYDIPIRPDADS